MTRFVWAIISLAVAIGVAPVAGAAGVLPKDLEWYLVNVARFGAADLAALESGQAIARVESGSSDSEVIAIAAVRIRTTREQAAAYYGQMISWVDGQVTLAFGKFSTPPVLADVGTLTLDEDEIEALRSCKPGDCDLKVSGVGLDTIRSRVDWKAPDAATQAQQAVRQAAVDYVSAYMQRGDDALITYDDTSRPVSLKEQWRSIVANSPYFQHYTPALQSYLTQYPRASLPGGRDIIYWIKENYGLKPVISIVHAVIYQPQQVDRTTIVQKQIFASHYYEGSAAVATVIGASDAGAPLTYIVYANRSRGDLLRGGFGGLKRTIAQKQAQQAARQTLETIKTALEKAAAGSPSR